MNETQSRGWPGAGDYAVAAVLGGLSFLVLSSEAEARHLRPDDIVVEISASGPELGAGIQLELGKPMLVELHARNDSGDPLSTDLHSPISSSVGTPLIRMVDVATGRGADVSTGRYWDAWSVADSRDRRFRLKAGERRLVARGDLHRTMLDERERCSTTVRRGPTRTISQSVVERCEATLAVAQSFFEGGRFVISAISYAHSNRIQINTGEPTLWRLELPGDLRKEIAFFDDEGSRKLYSAYNVDFGSFDATIVDLAELKWQMAVEEMRPPPIPVEGKVEPPSVIELEQPEYPELARRLEIEGRVVIEIVVDRGGRVVAARVDEGLDMGPNGVSLDAAEKARFRPARVEGEPVAVFWQLAFDFPPSRRAIDE